MRIVVKQLLWRLVADDDGQDLIEYGLLSAFIGICAAAPANIPPHIAAAYTNWDTTVQNLSACTPDPGGGGVQPHDGAAARRRCHHDRCRGL